MQVPSTDEHEIIDTNKYNDEILNNNTYLQG